jgi:hypothetical protein
MNPSNRRLPDRKAAKGAAAAKSAIVTSKAVAAKSTSAKNRVVVANRKVAAKGPAKKPADDRLRKGTGKALGDCALDYERREATPAVFRPVIPPAPTPVGQ